MRVQVRSGLAAVLVLVASSAVVTAQDADPSGDPAAGATVIPPTEDPLGIPYGDWAANWWTWLIKTPLADSPAEIDNCQAAQGGGVFYIPQVGPGVTKETSCTIGADQHILATAGGVIFDTTEDCGDTEEGLRACVEEIQPIFSGASVTVDGEVVPDIDSYWVFSPMFPTENIEGNFLEVPVGNAEAVVGGWFVMIEPLPPGSHTIVVHDEIDIPDDDAGPLPAELIANVKVVAQDEAEASPAG